MHALLLLLVPVALATNPIPRTCCMPSSFECTFTQTGAYQNPQTHMFDMIDNNGRLKYDYGRKMARYDHMVDMMDGSSEPMSVITDYTTGMAYTLFKGGCTIERKNESMYEPCIPTYARLISSNFLGSIHGGHLDMHTWRYEGAGFNIKLTVSADDCSPMAESVYGMTPDGISYETTYLFSDFTRGLMRNEYFDLPPECHGQASQFVLPFGKRSIPETPFKAFGL